MNSKIGSVHSPHCALPMEDLKAWVDGELSPLRRYVVARHVGGCSACQGEAETLRHFGAEMRDLDTAIPSPALRQRILANLPDAPLVPTTPVRWKPNPAPRYALAGAFCLLIAVGAFALNGQRQNRTAVPTVSEIQTTETQRHRDSTEKKGKTEEGNRNSVALTPNDPTTQRPNDPTPKVVRDETSAQADRIVAQQEKARERAEAQAWRTWLEQTPALPQSASLRSPAARFALTVPLENTEAAVETLRQKVVALGGKLYAVRSGNAPAGVFANAENLYAAQLPANQVKEFAATWRDTPSAMLSPLVKMPQFMNDRTATTTAAPRTDGTVPIKPTENKTTPTVATPKQQTGGKTDTVYLLIALRSQ